MICIRREEQDYEFPLNLRNRQRQTRFVKSQDRSKNKRRGYDNEDQQD